MSLTEQLHLRVSIKNAKNMPELTVRKVTEDALRIMKKYGMSQFSVEADFESKILKFGADTLKLGQEDSNFYKDCEHFMEKHKLEGIKIYPDPDAPKHESEMN